MNHCPIERHVLVTRTTLNLATGETAAELTEWVTGPCNTFIPTNKACCDSCAQLWTCPTNEITERGLGQLVAIEGDK